MGELIASLDEYVIYKSFNNNNSYFICIPKGNINKCQIFLGFSELEIDNLSNQEIVTMINNVNDMISKINKSAIYVVPNIKQSLLKEAVLENDDRMYTYILNNMIQPITADVYNLLIKNGIRKENIIQVIQIIEKNEDDKKLGGWLAIKLGDAYIKEIEYTKLFEKMNTQEVFKNNSVQSMESYNIPVNYQNGITPVNHDYEEVPTKENKNKLVKRLTLKNNNSSGYSSIKFMIMVLLSSLILGISIGYMIIK